MGTLASRAAEIGVRVQAQGKISRLYVQNPAILPFQFQRRCSQRLIIQKHDGRTCRAESVARRTGGGGWPNEDEGSVARTKWCTKASPLLLVKVKLTFL